MLKHRGIINKFNSIIPMNLNKKFFTCVLGCLVLFASCEDSDKNPAPYDVGLDNVPSGAYLKEIASETAINLFDIPNAGFSVTLAHHDNANGTLLQDVTVYLSFDDKTVVGGDDKSVAESLYATLPASAFTSESRPTITYTDATSDALAFLGLTAADLDGSDVVSYRFQDNLTNGLFFTNSNTNPNIISEPAFNSPFLYNATVVCPTDLEGTHSFVGSNLVAGNNPGVCPTGTVTGTVTWTALGGGEYDTTDLGFGQYESTCWNDGPAAGAGSQFTDACGLIVTGGTDQYGLVYIWTITDITGPEMTITWTNDYADSGTAVVTREGGVDWPALTTN